jgi:hypothetical protein
VDTCLPPEGSSDPRSCDGRAASCLREDPGGFGRGRPVYGTGNRYHRTVTDPLSSAAPADGSAPGPLGLIQSFANTLGSGPDEDLLCSREEAAGWLRTAGLLPAEAGLSNSEHSALLRLRESLRDVLAAHTDGRDAAAATARLTRALADGRLVLTVDPASTVQLASAARASYPNLVAAVAVAIAASAADGTWLRLKACSAPHCDQAVYDDSVPGAPAAGRCAAHAVGRLDGPGDVTGRRSGYGAGRALTMH